MARHQIVTVGKFAAILLPQDVLAQLNVQIGDEVDVSIIDHTLLLRSIEESERQQRLGQVIDSVFSRRKSAYERLA